MFAIIQSGGRQVRVTPGAIVEVDRVPLAAGDKVTIDQVLFVGKDDGGVLAGAPFVKYKTDALVRDDYSATFTTALMEKDIDLVLDAAEEGGAELPLALELKEQLRAAIEAGYGDDDFIALFQHLRRRSGLDTAGRTEGAVSRQPEQEVVP